MNRFRAFALLFVALLSTATAPGCSGTPVPVDGGGVISQTDTVLHEVVSAVGTVVAIVRHDVDTATPPPAHLPEIDAALTELLDVDRVLGDALGFYDLAAGPAKSAAACTVRAVGRRAVTALLHVVALLRDAGVPVPPLVAQLGEGLGLLVDAMTAGVCGGHGGEARAASAFAEVRAAFARHHVARVELPPAWRARFGAELAR